VADELDGRAEQDAAVVARDDVAAWAEDNVGKGRRRHRELDDLTACRDDRTHVDGRSCDEGGPAARRDDDGGSDVFGAVFDADAAESVVLDEDPFDVSAGLEARARALRGDVYGSKEEFRVDARVGRETDAARDGREQRLELGDFRGAQADALSP